MKLIKACIAMAAIAALFVIPSVASASPVLTHPTGTPIPAGTKIIATNVAHANTSNILKMTTGAGTIECATATLTGELETNSGTHIAGTITTAEFLGKPGVTPHGPHCAGGFAGNVTVTPNHVTNPCHTPEGGTQHCSLPWCVTASTLDDKFIVRGGKCSEPERPITFTLHTSLIGTCSYQKASIEGTYTTHPVDAIMTIEKQVFKRTTGSGFCPAEGSLDMAFTLTTDNAGVEGEKIYIS